MNLHYANGDTVAEAMEFGMNDFLQTQKEAFFHVFLNGLQHNESHLHRNKVRSTHHATTPKQLMSSLETLSSVCCRSEQEEPKMRSTVDRHQACARISLVSNRTWKSIGPVNAMDCCCHGLNLS